MTNQEPMNSKQETLREKLALLALAHPELEMSNQWLPVLEKFVQQEVREAQVSILKEIEPPEQFADYNKLMGASHCLACGFDSEKFREWIQDRIKQLEELNND